MNKAEEREVATEYLTNNVFVSFCRFMHAECLHERSLNNDSRSLEFYQYYMDNFEYLLNEYKNNVRKER